MICRLWTVCACSSWVREVRSRAGDGFNYRTLQARRDTLTCKRLVLTHVGAQMQNRLAEVEEEVAGDGLVITL